VRNLGQRSRCPRRPRTCSEWNLLSLVLSQVADRLSYNMGKTEKQKRLRDLMGQLEGSGCPRRDAVSTFISNYCCHLLFDMHKIEKRLRGLEGKDHIALAVRVRVQNAIVGPE
jgi:hypothetical protein